MNIKAEIDEKSVAKLEEINNPHVVKIIEKYVELCQPAKVTVLGDSEEDLQYIRALALKNKEEKKLNTEGHTIHYDNYYDQARDKKHTWVLLPKGKKLSEHISTVDYDEGVNEAMGLLNGIMKGKEMLVCFHCLGPSNSKFSIPAMQITDSATVAHQQQILYRKGNAAFKELNGSKDFFHVIHSAGELNDDGTTKNIDKRRVFIDLEEERVISMNNQYGGSSVGLKKLSLRLSISRANKEDWLCEHMFVMGVHKGDRITYFTGAFPSWCGKTSTAMISGQSIVGDDIAFLRKDDEGYCVAANVEQGIFGVIADINEKDDSVIYKAITSPREVVINNVLTVDNEPYWIGMGKEIPKKGFNHSGEWFEGKKDDEGKLITPSHKNARFALKINDLDNADENADNPKGVEVGGIIYGGRDSDTTVPVAQSLSWAHGVFVGASIESESTVAAIGAEGVLDHSPMANMDFLVVPLGVYIKNHMKFGDDLDKAPTIFATNYFFKKDGEFVNAKTDKKAWLLWMEGRVNEEYEAIETPIGHIPKYEDLKDLFKELFDKEFSKEDYEYSFSIRIHNLLKKLDRIESIYKSEPDIPEVFHKHLEQQRQRLNDAKEKYGKDVILPGDFE
ncbi:phosphoenolpyruvate carboxykinase (GTP) [Candidatus Pacearchaeota archaeon]|nr:phosphoenolpyruvate carboxykinase (GTP) [Candidatus Pacearchaeota archaeon]